MNADTKIYSAICMWNTQPVDIKGAKARIYKWKMYMHITRHEQLRGFIHPGLIAGLPRYQYSRTAEYYKLHTMGTSQTGKLLSSHSSRSICWTIYSITTYPMQCIMIQRIPQLSSPVGKNTSRIHKTKPKCINLNARSVCVNL